MKTIRQLQAMQDLAQAFRQQGETIGLVPTMGYLHAGHLSLIEKAKAQCDRVVVSIFVNPMQFGPQEDFAIYPRDIDGDVEKIISAGGDVLFMPSDSDIYPQTFQTQVSVSQLTKGLCGRSRSGHFDGVTTVVTKLFHLTQPHRAYFGEKDYQQLQVIKQMVEDLNFPLTIVPMPIVRDPDGLAMSSRNAFLKDRERDIALALPRALARAQTKTQKGLWDCKALCCDIAKDLKKHSEIEIDYVEIIHPETLKPLGECGENFFGRVCVALRLGQVRLIDNCLLGTSDPQQRVTVT